MSAFAQGRHVEVELHSDWLRAPLGPGESADFHLRWLRHNCELDRHPQTGERTLCSSEIRDDLRAARAFVDGSELIVEWEGESRTSRYELAWLSRHAYAKNRTAVAPPPNDVAAHEIFAGATLDDALVDRAIAHVRRDGFVVVRRSAPGRSSPEDETEPLVDRFVARGLFVRSTHFGRIEDLRTDNVTNQNTDQLGYTDAGIELHTDQPFLEDPPRYQLLQCVRAAERGGASLVADGLLAYRYLASIDARAAEVLRTVPLVFHRKQQAFESIVRAPLVARASDEAFFLRSSYFTLAPYDRPFDEMGELYRALDTFARLVRDPAHRYAFTLAPGELLLYDNHRMLHGQTAFEGPRWVRGIYFDEGASRG